MSNLGLFNKKRDGKKMFNVFKYLVLIFAFMFVGVVVANHKISADVSFSVTHGSAVKGWTDESGTFTINYTAPSGNTGLNTRWSILYVCKNNYTRYGSDDLGDISSRPILAPDVSFLKESTGCKSSDFIITEGETYAYINKNDLSVTGKGWRNGWIDGDKYYTDVSVTSISGWLSDLGINKKDGFLVGFITCYIAVGGTMTYNEQGAVLIPANAYQTPDFTLSGTTASWAKSHTVNYTKTSSNSVTAYYHWTTDSTNHIYCRKGVIGKSNCHSEITMSDRATKSDGNGKYTVWVMLVDSYGNASVKSKGEFWIDNAKPDNVTFNPRSNVDFSNDLRVTLESGDESPSSGFRIYFCSTKSAECTVNASSENIATGEGAELINGEKVTICAQAKDSVGNWSPSKTCTGTFNYDDEAPKITFTGLNREKAPSYTIGIQAKDDTSTIVRIKYCIATSVVTDEANCVYKAEEPASGSKTKSISFKIDKESMYSYGMTEGVSYYIGALAEDIAGNVTEWDWDWDDDEGTEDTLCLDTTAPSVTFTHTTTPGVPFVYASSVTGHAIKVTSDDSGEGQKIDYYWQSISSPSKFGSKTNQEFSGVDGLTIPMPTEITSDGGYILYVKVTDEFKNPSEWVYSDVTCYLDTTPVKVQSSSISVYKTDNEGAIHTATSSSKPVVGPNLTMAITFTIVDDNLSSLIPTEIASSQLDDYISYSSGFTCEMPQSMYVISSGTTTLTYDLRLTCTSTSGQNLEPLKISLKTKASDDLEEGNYFGDKAGNGASTSSSESEIAYVFFDSKIAGMTAKLQTTKTSYMAGEIILIDVEFDEELVAEAGSTGQLTLPKLIYRTDETDESKRTVDTGEYISATKLRYSIVADEVIMTKGIYASGFELDADHYEGVSGNRLVDKGGNLPLGSISSNIDVGANTTRTTINSVTAELSVHSTFSTIFNIGSGNTTYVNENLYLRLLVNFTVYVGVGMGYDASSYTLNDDAIAVELDTNIWDGYSWGEVASRDHSANASGYMSITQYIIIGQIGSMGNGHIVLHERLIQGTGSYTSIYNDRYDTNIDLVFNEEEPEVLFSGNNFAVDGVINITPNVKSGESYYDERGNVQTGCDMLQSTSNCTVNGSQLVISGLATGSNTINPKVLFNKYGEQVAGDQLPTNNVDSDALKVTASLKTAADGYFMEKVNDATYYYYFETGKSVVNFVINIDVGSTGDGINRISETYNGETVSNFELSPTVSPSFTAHGSGTNLVRYTVTFNSGVTKTIDVNVIEYDSSKVSLVVGKVCGVISSTNPPSCSLNNIYNNEATVEFVVVDGNTPSYTKGVLSGLTVSSITTLYSNINLSSVDVDSGVVTLKIKFDHQTKSLATINKGVIVESIGFVDSFKSVTGQNVSGDPLAIKFVNTAPVYIPIKENSASSLRYEVSCESSTFCNVLLEDDQFVVPGTPEDPAFFLTVNGETNGSIITRTDMVNNEIEFTGVRTFRYLSDNEAPVIKTVSGPKDATCTNSITSLAKGSNMCFVITVEDDIGNGFVLDRSFVVNTHNEYFQVQRFEVANVTDGAAPFTHTIHLIVRYHTDTWTETHEITKLVITMKFGAIRDCYKANVVAEKSSEEYSLTLIPNGLSLSDVEIVGTGLNGYYNDYRVVVSFNKKLASEGGIPSAPLYAMVGENTLYFTCTLSDNAMTCIKPDGLTANGMHNIYLNGTFVDEDGLSLTFNNQQVKSLVYDTAGPSININTSKTMYGQYDTDHGFEIGVNVSDSGVGVDLNTVLQGIPTVKAGGTECSNVKIRYENGIHIISVGKCSTAGTVSFQFSNWVKDKLGNEYISQEKTVEGMTIGTGQMILNEDSPSYTHGAIQANEEVELRFTFNMEIKVLKCLSIEITSGNADIVRCYKKVDLMDEDDITDADRNILILKVKAKYGGTGSISLVIGAGAIAYENTEKTISYKYAGKSFNLDLEVLSGEYKIGFDGIIASGCNGFYCGSEGLFEFNFTANRNITNTGINNMTLIIGGVEKDPIGATISGRNISFTYDVGENDNGQMSLKGISLGAQDDAGNTGLLDSTASYLLSVEMMKYQIITSAAAFDGTSINQVVFVGSSFASLKETIERAYNLSSFRTHEFVWEEEATLVNNDLFAEIGEFVITMTAIDAAGNDSVLTINLDVQFGGDIKVTLKNKSHTYNGLGYSFGGASEIEVELPSLVANMDKSFMSNALLNAIKAKFNSAVYVIDDTAQTLAERGKNVGVYTITTDVTEVEIEEDDDLYLVGTFDVEVVTGVYTVKKQGLAINIDNCTVPTLQITYSGDPNLYTNYRFNCGDIELVGSSVTVANPNVGTTTYTISGISVSEGDASNYEVSGASILTGTVVISPKEIDITNYAFEEINKYYDGDNSVGVNKGTFSSIADTKGQSITISWTRGEYVLGDDWESGEVVVRLYGVYVSSTTNYSIKGQSEEFVVAKGTLLKDGSFGYTVGYYKDNKVATITNYVEEIYSNVSVTFKVTNYVGNVVNNYKGNDVSELFTHKWRVCSSKVDLDNPIWSNGNCNIVSENNEYTMSTNGWLYLEVSDPSGNVIIKEMRLNYNATGIVLNNIYLNDYAEGNISVPMAKTNTSNVYRLDEIIVVVLGFDRNIKTVAETLVLKGKYDSYTFTLYEVKDNLVAYVYQVSSADESDIEVEIVESSLISFKDKMYDYYGNTYVYDSVRGTDFDEDEDGTYSIEIDRAPADISGIYFSIEGVTQKVGNTYYVNTVTGAGKTLTVRFEFGEETGIVDYPKTITIGTNITLNCAVAGDDNEQLVCSKVLTSGDLSDKEGKLAITHFSQKKMAFANRTIDLLVSEMSAYIKEAIYVDNLNFKYELETKETEIRDSAIIKYECNKDNKTANCLLTAENLIVKLGNVDVPAANITIDEDTITITGLSSMNIAEGDLVVKVNSSKKDFVGNGATSNEIKLFADNQPLRVQTIQSIGCEECGENGIVKVVVTFNKPIAKVDGVEIITTDEDIKLSYLLIEGNQVQFVYSVTKLNVDETIGLVRFSSNKISDVLGNVLDADELNLSDNSMSGSISIDTLPPVLDGYDSEAVGCNSGVCNITGKVNLKISFSEVVEEYDNLRIDTNFGVFEHLMSSIVRSQIVVLTIEIDDSLATNLDSFVVNSISGNFYDKAGNKLVVNETSNVYEDEDISLDSSILGVTSVVIDDTIANNDADGVKYYKSGDQFTITVTFSKPIANIDELLGNVRLDMYFDKSANGFWNKVVTNDKQSVIFTYTVSPSDNGQLGNNLKLEAVGLKDAAGNTLYTALPSYDNKVVVDNLDLEIKLSNVGNNDKGSSSAKIRYECNKAYVNCTLTADKFNILKNGEALDVDVTLTTEDGFKIAIISGLSGISSTDALEVKINKDVIFDYTGRGNKVTSVFVDKDTSSMEVLYSYGIEVSAAAPTYCVGGICKSGDKLKIRVPFNKNIASYEEGIYLDVQIGDEVSSNPAKFSRLDGNFLEFEYEVQEGQNGEIRILSINGPGSYLVKDNLGNENEEKPIVIRDGYQLVDDYIVDTKEPELLDENYVSSVAKDCDENGFCTIGNKIRVSLYFNEEVYKYKNLIIETNFGIFNGEGITQVVESAVVNVEIVVSATGSLDKFIITKITGVFYDKYDNEKVVNLESVKDASDNMVNVHENSNIKLDTIAPTIEDVLVSGCNEVDGVSYCKAGDEITVTVIFSESLENTEASKNRPKLSIMFDNVGRGDITSVVSAGKQVITYTYVIAAGDSGELSSLELNGGYLTDVVGNAVRLDIDEDDLNAIKVVVDNAKAKVNSVKLIKDSKEVKANLFVKSGDVISISVMFDDVVSGVPTLFVKDVNGNTIHEFNGTVEDDSSITYIYVVGDEAGVVSLVLEGEVYDRALNEAELPYEYKTYSINVVNGGNDLVFVREKEVIATADININRVLIYTIEQDNELTFEDTYNKIKNEFDLLCRISGEANFLDVCKYQGYTITEIPLNVVVEKGEGVYNVYWNTNGLDVSYDAHLIELKLVYTGSNIKDLAGNAITVTVDEAGNDVVTYDNIKRSVKSFEFTTDKTVGTRYYVKEGSIVNVSLEFNAPLANGIGINDRYPLIVKLNNSITVELDTVDGVTYTGVYTYDGTRALCANEARECIVSAAIASKDSAIGRTIETVKGSNNVVYSITTITNTNLYVDDIEPVATISHSHANNIVGNTIVAKFECVDNAGSKYASGCANIEVLVNGTAYTPDGNGQYNIDISSIFTTEVTVVFIAKDRMDNSSRNEYTFVVDHAPPTMTINDAHINAPIASGGNSILVEVSDSQSNLAKNSEIQYRWVKVGAAEGQWKYATLTNGKVSIAVPLDDGVYTLSVTGATDSLGNVNNEVVTSKEITIDNTAPEIIESVLSAGKCIKDTTTGMIYCGKYDSEYSILRMTITFDDPSQLTVTKVESLHFETIQQTLIGNVLSFGLRVKSDVVENKANMDVLISVQDALGFKKDHTISLENVMIDVKDDVEVTVELDNAVGQKGTKIDVLDIVDESGYAPINRITCELSDGSACNIETIKEKAFDENVTLTIKYQDMVGNSGTFTKAIQIDNEEVQVKYEVLDSSMVATADRNDVIRVFNKNVTIKLSEFSEKAKFKISFCDAEYLTCEVKYESTEYSDAEVSKVIDMINDFEYVLVEVIDQGLNVVEYAFALKYLVPTVVTGEDIWAQSHTITVNGHEDYSKITYQVTKGMQSSVPAPLTNGVATIDGRNLSYNGEYTVLVVAYISNNHYKELDSFTLKFDNEINLNNFVVNYIDASGNIYNGNWTNGNVFIEISEVDEDESTELSGLKKVFVDDKECGIDDGKIVCEIEEYNKYTIVIEDNAGNIVKIRDREIKIDKEGFAIETSTLLSKFLKGHSVVFNFNGVAGAPFVKALWLLVPQDGSIDIEGVTANTFNEFYLQYMYDLPKGQGDNPNKLAMVIGNDDLNGLYSLFVYTIDEAGNEELIRELLMFDNEGPEINVDISNYYAKYELDANGDLIDVTNDKKVAVFEDEYVDKDAADRIEVTYTFKKDDKVIFMDELQGEYVLVIEAKDSLGNVSQREVNIKVDNVGPNIVLENNGTNASPVFTVTDINGVNWESAEYCIYTFAVCDNSYLEKAESYDEVENKLNIILENNSYIGNIGIRVRILDNLSNVADKAFNLYYDNEAPIVDVADVRANSGNAMRFDNANNEMYATIADYTSSYIYIDILIGEYLDSFDGRNKGALKVCFGNHMIENSKAFDSCGSVETPSPLRLDEATNKYKVTYLIRSNGYLNIYVEDVVGNYTIKRVFVNNISDSVPDFSLNVDNSPSQSKVIDIVIKDDLEDITSIEYKVLDFATKYTNTSLSSLYEGSEVPVISVNKDKLNIENADNNVYIVKVTNKWGNSSYKAIRVNALDKSAPSYNEGKDFELTVNGGKVLKEVYENEILKGYEVVTTIAANANKFVYNTGDVRLVFPASTVYDEILNGYDLGQKVFIEICYNGACAPLVDVSIDSNGNNVGSAKSLNELFGLEEFVGTITYQIKDEAGNLGDLRSFYIERNVDVKSTISTTLNNKTGWLNAYNVTYTSVSNGLLIDKVEYYFDGTACVNELEEGIEKNIACANLDGLYTLKYKITDKLGYVKEGVVEIEGSQLNNIPLDTIAPVNTDRNLVSFGLHKDNSNYYIRYNVLAEGIEESAKMNILYADDTLYCVINDAHRVSSGDCDLVDINKFDGTRLNFKTKVVDKAGNISVLTQEYSLEYNESRSVTVGNAKYDGITKTITIDIIVNNPTEKVNRFEVSVENGTNNWVLSNDLSVAVTGVNNRYKLTISATNFATLFTNGFINKRIQIKVFDNYTVNEGLAIGQMGEPAVVDVNFDTNDPEISISVSNPIIKTDGKENTFTFAVNNKTSEKISKVQYIIQRTSNVAALATITRDNFTTEYLDCKYCASNGVVAGNTITLAQDSTLESGTYRLIVFVEDVYGNKQISSKNISIDNTKPVFKMVNASNIDNYVQKGEYKVYSQTIRVYALDNVSKFYNSEVKSFVVQNIKTTVETSINLDQEFITMGGRNSNFTDGEYLLIVEDVAGNVRTQKLIVDTENDGFGIVSSDGVDTSDKVFNLEGLDKLSVILYEDMSYLRFELSVGSSKKIWFEVETNSCRYTLDNNQTRNCASGWEDVMKFRLNERIRISDILSLANGYTLNENLNKLHIRADNVSGIKAESDIALDFSVPAIVVNRSIKGKMLEVLGEIVNEEHGVNISCKDVYGKVVYDCRKHDTKVVTSTGNEFASSIKEILTSYIKSVDSKSYSAIISDNDRFIINYYNINNPENVKTIYTSENDWEYFTTILKEVGEYVIEYTYKDAAGNVAKPAYLVVNVVDNDGPTVINENNIKLANNLYINDANGSEYTVLSIKATDAYGFDETGTIKEKKFYDFDLVMVKADGTKVVVEFVLEGGAYVGRIDGIKYVVRATDLGGNVRYTFVKQAQYELVYNVYDYVGNAPKNIFKVTIDVFDKHAPNLVDKNEITLTDNVRITIKNETYTIVEDASGMKLVDALGVEIEIRNNIFDLNGERFEIDRDAGKVYRVLNIDNSKICFRGGSTCAVDLLELESKDDEDLEDKIVDISEISYSRLGTTYTSAKANIDYVLVPTEEPASIAKFRVKNISFALVGYYKVVFYSVDSSNNRSEVTYIIKVEDTEAPKFMKDEVEVGENFVKEQEYDENFAEEVRGAKYPGATEEEKIAKYIEAWVKANITLSHNYIKDVNIQYTIEEIRLLDELFGQEYLKYSVILRAEDSSNNVSTLEFMFKIMDTVSPENGIVEISFDGNTVVDTSGVISLDGYDTNAENIYFKLSGASDTTNQLEYEYKVYIDGIEPILWNKYEGGFELGYTSFSGEVRTIQIAFRVKDRVGNLSSELGDFSVPLRVDTIAPVIYMDTMDEEPNVEVEDGAVYQGSGRVRVTFREDKGRMRVLAYRNNKKIRDTSFTSDDTLELSGFGHYKFIANDPAGNEAVREFVIMPADNTFSVIDNTFLDDSMNAAEEFKKFDMVIFQKISQDGNSFYFEDMSLVGDKDNVFLMGVVPDREGSIFSIYASGAIGGSVFKQYTDYFPLNSTTNIKNINPAYKLSDYVINYKGEKYILIGIEKDGYEGPTQDQQQNGDSKKGGADFTWIFFVLGGAGAIGGVFLIMKLRKRVRAA